MHKMYSITTPPQVQARSTNTVAPAKTPRMTTEHRKINQNTFFHSTSITFINFIFQDLLRWKFNPLYCIKLFINSVSGFKDNSKSPTPKDRPNIVLCGEPEQ